MDDAPWLKYQQAAPASTDTAATAEGPWTKYAQAAAPAAAQPSMDDRARAAIKERYGNSRFTEAVGEPALQAVTGAAGAVAGGLRGVYDLATGQGADKAADDVRSTQEAMTRTPRSEAGKKASEAINYVPQKIAQGADAAGAKVAEVTGSPALGAATNTALQAAPALLTDGILRARGKAGVKSTAEAAPAAATPEARAREFVASRTGLDWNALPDALKKTVTDIAQDAKRLDNLDPRAIERVARAQELKYPISRGQAERNLTQITREENIRKSKAGEELRGIDAEQDRVLHQHLDTLRKETGAKAETRQAVGASTQTALRAKLRETKTRAKEAYDLATNLGEKEIVRVDDLDNFLKHPINEANVGWVGSRLKALKNEDGSISLKNLEDVRQELTAAAKTRDKGGHYAGEAIKVIDKIMDDAGSSAYRNARSQWKAMKDEFDKQGRVKRLVSEKGMSSDRAVALEDTFDSTVLRGSAEDLRRVQKSLMTGDAKSAVRGAQAWKDLQGATIDYLKEKAAGRRAIVGEQGQMEFGAAYREAFSELEKDGKIDVLFSKPQAARLRQIYEAVGDVRTKPSGRVAGSDTVPRLISMLDKVSKIPFIGHGADVVAGAATKLHNIGREGREARHAQRSPLDDAAASANKAAAQAERRQRNRRAAERAAPLSGATLGDQQ